MQVSGWVILSAEAQGPSHALVVETPTVPADLIRPILQIAFHLDYH